MNANINLECQLMKDGDFVVVHCPSLDLCGYGRTSDEAKKDFDAAFKIFIEETARRGTLAKALEELGWKKILVNNMPQWAPRVEIIKNIIREVNLPIPS